MSYLASDLTLRDMAEDRRAAAAKKPPAPPEARKTYPAIVCMQSLAKALAVRRQKLGLTQLAVDFAAGLASGHCAKLECGDKGLGDKTVPRLLEALDIELKIVEKRNASAHVMPAYAFPLSKKVRTPEERKKDVRRAGGFATMSKMTKKERSLFAAKAARARWAKRRTAAAEM
jgi:hypothetical protein